MQQDDQKLNDEHLAQELFEKLLNIQVSRGPLDDAITLYANEEISDQGERDEFIEQYWSDEEILPLVKKIVFDVVAAFAAAELASSDNVFAAVIQLMEVVDDDEVLQRMQVIMVDKMLEDAIAEFPSDVVIAVKRRIAYYRNLVA